MNATPPDISVVIGSQNTRQSVAPCLQSLLAQSEKLNVEIIVADASTDGSADLIAGEFPQVKLIRNAPDALVPHLWQQGIDAAQAPIIAITIAQCIPAPDWLAQILAALRNGAAAVGGPLSGPEGDHEGGPHGGSNLDWALYFSRYSNWMPPGTAGPIHDLAGDNAAYKRAALDLCQAEMQGGFWETLVHARLLAEGEQLLWSPYMVVTFGPADTLAATMKVRLRHGRHYGSTRSGNTWFNRLLRVAASPLLVPLLLTRIFRRVRQRRPDWMPYFWRALPALLLILISWSIGEMSGYAWPQTPRMRGE